MKVTSPRGLGALGTLYTTALAPNSSSGSPPSRLVDRAAEQRAFFDYNQARAAEDSAWAELRRSSKLLLATLRVVRAP